MIREFGWWVWLPAFHSAISCSAISSGVRFLTGFCLDGDFLGIAPLTQCSAEEVLSCVQQLFGVARGALQARVFFEDAAIHDDEESGVGGVFGGLPVDDAFL